MSLIACIGALFLFVLGLYVSWDDGTLYRCLFGGLALLVLAILLDGVPAVLSAWRKPS